MHTTVSQNFGISAVKPTSDGKYIVVGENYISKMNKARAIEWSTLIFEEEPDRFTSLNYVMQARDDGYLFAGRDFVRDQWIYGKLDAGGSYMFVKETGDYSQGSVAAIFEDTNGFFVIGYVGSGAERDIQLLWTDHNGNKITDKRISRAGEQYVRDVQKIGNNYLIIGDSGSLNTNGYTVMIDQAGNIVRDFISVGTGSTTLQSAYILEDGSYFLTGSDLSSGQRALLIKVNANHEQEWMRTYPSQTNSNSLAYHIASTLDGGYIIAGGNNSLNGMLLKIDANGNRQWEKWFAGTYNLRFVEQLEDGSYLTAGNAASGPFLHVKVGAPAELSIDDASNTIIGLTEAMEYSLDNGTVYTPYLSSAPPIFPGDLNVLVRYKQDWSAGYEAGAPIELKFTQNAIAASVSELDKLIVPNGTELSALELPEKVEVTLSDDTTLDVAVAWDNGTPAYNGTVAGTYLFKGDLALPVGIDNPQELAASIVVEVEEAPVVPVTVKSVAQMDKLIVPNGTELSALELPEKVEVTLSDDTTLEVAVSWDNGTPAYNGTVAGTYLFSGNLALPAGIDNPGELVASIEVEVEEAPIVAVTVESVAQLDKLIVPNGTELSTLELPEKVEVTLSDNTTLEVAVAWDSGTPAYNGTVAGTYQFKGNLALPAGIENPGELVASIEVEVEEAPIVAVTVESVAQLDKLIVPTGTEQSALELPEKVEVTLSDDTTLEVAVAWDNGKPAYNGTVAGTYHFKGNLALPAGIDNPGELVASIEIEVEEAPVVAVTVESVAQLDKLIVPYKTELIELKLPEKVELTLSDNTTLEVAVAWDNGTPAYNGTVAGTYLFRGNLALPAGIENPGELVASIEVEVKEAPIVAVTVESVAQLDKLIVPNGTELSALELPEKVEVTLSDDKTLEVAVSWDNGTPAYNGTVAGTYLFKGNLALPAGIDNPQELTASIEVEVEEAPVVPVTVKSVAQLEKLIMPNGTELSALALPEKVEVTLSDDTTLEVAVSWDNGTPAYNGTVAGTYQFKGNLALPAGIDNPQELTASIEVEVEEAPVVPVTVESVAQLDKLIVPNGTEQSALELPEKVEVTLSDDTTLEVAVAWDNGTPAYNGTVAGTYLFKGNLALPVGIDNPQELAASIVVEVEEAPVVPVTVKSVAQMDKLIVPNGTELSVLELPAKVKVTLSDDTTLEVAVAWDNGTPAYNGTVAGTYLFKGDLSLPAGIENPGELVASIEVEVEEAPIVAVTVESVAQLDKLIVPNGTELSAIELPEKVKVTLSDNTTLEVAVSWDNFTPAYNGTVAGTYQFKGELALPAGINNPQGLVASIEVEVEEAPIVPVTVESVAQLDKLIVPNGTQRTTLELPEKVEVTLSDNTTLEVAVTWDNGTPAYNGTVAGTYQFKGNLALPAGISNPQELVAGIEVEVEEAQVVPVTVKLVAELEKLTVTYGTELSALELPEKVKVTLSDNTALEVAVTWDNGTPTYNGAVAGTYQFKGNLALPAGIDNPQQLAAGISVEVARQVISPQPSVPSNKLYLYCNEIGCSTSYGNELKVEIGSNAYDGPFTVSIEKLALSEQQRAALPAESQPLSAAFELLKSFEGSLKQPTRLSFAFDESMLQQGYRAALHYYDPVQAEWLEIAGEVDAGTFVAEVDQFATFALLAVKDEVLLENPSPESPAQFNDTANHWAQLAIKRAAAIQLVDGFADGSFRPDELITREQFITILARALGWTDSAAKLDFQDADTVAPWAAQAVAAAVEHQVIQGYADGTVRPSEAITRAEMVAFISRAVEWDDHNAEDQALSSFTDHAEVPKWASAAFAKAVEEKLIVGSSSQKLEPLQIATRAEAVVMLIRLLDLLGLNS
ncbi:hypothetical protein J40TS1_32850 [Paenibacillus montaniterrae]|uniref:SLH domain-containing protein n=1 Tax=Paenibacillus montaniterrae TaxID=429341 RepID=A0A919YVM3_9BACL|nr:hypothetical protein J40TS1_32850 [Paenibacillus montaniterrae]